MLKERNPSPGIISTTYTFDAKNFYLREETDTEVGTERSDVGMYFRKDKTPIVGVSTMKDKTAGPREEFAEIKFYEYPCGKNKGAVCDFKDITSEIFPALDISIYLNPDVKIPENMRKMLIVYEIPRIGTTIKARIGYRGDSSDLKNYLKYTGCNIDWHKSTEKFEIGKCGKNFDIYKFFSD